MKDNMPFVIAVLAFCLAVYLVLAYFIALVNKSRMTCPAHQHIVANPLTLGATGTCRP